MNKSNIIVGVIYKHLFINLTGFNCNYLNKLIQKSNFVDRDFNDDLLNYNEHNQTN